MKQYGRSLLILVLSAAMLAGCNKAPSSSSSEPEEPQVSLEVPDSSSSGEIAPIEVTMDKVALANTGEAFLAAYGRVSKNVVEYNWYGNDVYSAMFYIEGSGETQATAYEDSNGYIEVTTSGNGYIFDPSTNTFSVRHYLGDTYEKTLGQSIDYFVFQEMDYEKIVSTELSESGDVLTLVTEFDVADDLEYYKTTYGIEKGTIRNVYELDPQTLMIRRLEVKLADGGAVSPVCEVTVNPEADYTVADEIAALINPEKTRKLTVVTDPDTSSEKTETAVFASGVRLQLMAPDGYKLYSDRAGTKAYTADAGSGDVTVYLKKG